MEDKPWWHPEPTDEAWLAQLRADYPYTAELSDEEIRDAFAEDCKYADTWDHLGDAREAYERLADDWIRMRKAIKSAPHQMGCRSLRDGMTALTIGNISDCDCWKRKALGGE